MEMCVDHQLHLVSIWLPNDEKDVAILEPVYRQYKGTKYRVAVFRSGREDLLNNTAKLLKINKQYEGKIVVICESYRRKRHLFTEKGFYTD